jgi:RNA polymerase sigma factor (sigma-70 family)
MPADYGYIKRTEGADGDAVDVFIGPHRQSEMVYVIDQCNEHGSFDEHKVMIGFTNYKKAVETYKAAYSKGWKVGKVIPMTMQQFKTWLKEGDKRSEIQNQVSRYAFDMFDDAGKPRLRPVTLAGTGSYAPVPQTWATSTNSPHVMSHQSQMPQDGVKQPWHMSIHEFAQHHAKNPGMINGGLSGDDGYHAHEFIKKHFGPETYRVFKFSDQARKQHIYNIAHAMRTGQPVHPDAIAHYPRDIVPQQHSQSGGMQYSASADRYAESESNFGLPPIPEGHVRLTHFFANPKLREKFLTGEPFSYKRQGSINQTADAFSENKHIDRTLAEGTAGNFERKPFGDNVLIMDIPHEEYRIHGVAHSSPGEVHNGRILGVHDRLTGGFAKNPAYGSAPKLQATQRKTRFDTQGSDRNKAPTPIPSPQTNGDSQSVRPDDIWSASSASDVDRYANKLESGIVANLTDDHHSKLGDYISKPENMLNGYKALREHGIGKDAMLTGDDQNLIMLHAGALGNHSVGKHIWGDAYNLANEFQSQPDMPAHQFMMKLGHGLAKHGNEARKQQAEERASGAKVVAFKNDRSGLRMLLHPAVRNDRTSDWQLSTIGSDGRPSGHYNPDSFSDGLHQALGVHHQPYWNHQGFQIEWTDKDGTKAPYSIAADVDRYAKTKTNFSDQPGLLHSAGGRWITIGAEEGDDGEKHGGQKILIGGDGKMKTGHFSGKTFGQAFGDKNPNTTHDEPRSKPKQKSLFDTRGHADQKLLFGDDATPDDMILAPQVQQQAPAPAPVPAPVPTPAKLPSAQPAVPAPQSQGIIQPPREIPNEQVKPGQQLGLFGDAPVPKVKSPSIDVGSGPKPKQSNLFDTHGNADQMDLFGDGFMPDDMVYKPQGQPQEPMQAAPEQAQGVDDLIAQAQPFAVKGQGYNRNVAAPLNRLLNAQAEGKEPKMIDWLADELKTRLEHWSKIDKPQVEMQSPEDAPPPVEQPSQSPEPSAASPVSPVSPIARPEEAEHADHNLSLGEGDQQKLSDDEFSQELNHPGLRKYLLKQARKMTNDPDAAEDIVQDAMMKAWNSRKNFDPAQSFQTWMHSIMRRTAINEHRDRNAKKRGGGLSIQSMDAAVGGDESENLHGAIGSDLRRQNKKPEDMDVEALRAAVPKLQGAQKRVVELFLEGNSPAEVARNLQITQAAVGQAMKRAHATLREMIGEDNYALKAIVERYRIEADRSYYQMCLRVYRYSVFGETDRYEFTEEDHPRVEHGKSEGGQFSLKMHNGTPIADRPSVVDPGHSLHLSSVAKNPETQHIAKGLHAAKMSLDSLWSEANRKHQADQSPESAGKTPYHHVDWGKVKGHLDSINQAHREGLSKGHNVANIANYNGTIPQWLIPKLAGGRKFVDPSLLGSRWAKDTQRPVSPGASPAPMATQPQAQKHDLDSDGFSAPQHMKSAYDELSRQANAIPHDRKTGFSNPEDRAKWKDLMSKADKIKIEADGMRDKAKSMGQPSLPVQPQANNQPAQTKPLDPLQGNQPQPQPQAGFSGASRNYRAGMNQGSIVFSDPLHRDLYDLAAKSRSNTLNAGDKPRQNTNDLLAKIKSHPQIQEAISRHGINDGQIESFARQTYDHIKSQMKGLKEGEVRRPGIPEMPWSKQSSPEPMEDEQPVGDQRLEDEERPWDPSHPNHPDFDPIASAESSDNQSGPRELKPPSGLTARQFKNVTDNIRKNHIPDHLQDELDDSHIHAIGHMAAGMHNLENEPIQRRLSMFAELVGENLEARRKQARMTAQEAHQQEKARIEQMPGLEESEKQRLLAQAESARKENEADLLDKAARASRSAINIKLTNMRKMASGDYDSVSAAKKSKMFAGWDSKAASLQQNYPDVFSGLGSEQTAEQRLWDMLSEPYPVIQPLRNHEAILRAAVEHFLQDYEAQNALQDMKKEHGQTNKTAETVPFSAFGHARIDRYVLGAYARYSLTKSLLNFCSKAS